MRVMFLAQCYSPEEVSAAVLITELAIDLVRRGHRVTMVTGAPNYPYGRVFEGYKNQIYGIEMLNGVRVVRIWSYISPRRTFWRSILHYGTYSAAAFYGGLFSKKPDVIVSYSPPLPLGLSAWLLSRIWRIPWVLQLEDLYPDAAIAAGMLRNGTAIRFFSALERFLYRQATHISLISETFRQNLHNKGVPPHKITLIPVWADPGVVQSLPKENRFRERHGLKNKFVVMYAGNIGLTSSLEDVIATADLLNHDPAIIFVILGEGVKKSKLQGMAKSKGLENVLFLPYQPREDFPEILAAADMSLVTLNQNSFLSSLPSKTFNIMASARPILALTPAESEIAQLVEEGRCGINIPPNHPNLLAEKIFQLKTQGSRLEEMGQNGRIRLETRFARERCVDLYDRMLQRLCEKNT